MFYRRIVLALFMSLLFLSCSNKNKTHKEIVSDWSLLEEVNYSVKYPHTWSLNQTGFQGTSFLIIARQTSIRDFYQENLSMVEKAIADTMDLISYVKSNIAMLDKTVERFEILEQEMKELEGDRFYRLLYVGIESKYKILYEKHYRIKDKQAYVTTFACRTMEADRYRPIGRAMLKSFKLR